MKILAIRGKNLASLAGEFEIPFQQEPLASAGLFAISGPTGAGKSTLLDALCLALYDGTPRLLNAGSTGTKLPDVAGETVTPQDTRTLLRRGAADGYAEVDFVGNDGLSYRARWSVRRSRTKTDGKLQATAMTLKSLPDEQPIGGSNKGEIKAEIAKRIGLSFEQFTRSVLLAQNEFSTFLKADDNERGELLETLTGIVIYSAISKRAYEREKIEKVALERLIDRLADQKPLTPEARLTLEQESKLADDALRVLESRKQELDAHLRWHEVWSKAQSSERTAQQELDECQRAQQAAAPRKARFAQVESVQAARPLLGDCERIKLEMAHTQLTIVEAEAQLGRAAQELQAANEKLEQARHSLSDAEQSQLDAAPELDKAKELDTQLEALTPHHQQALQLQESARMAETLALQSLQANQQESARALQEQKIAADWLERNSRLNKLADGWSRWDTLFGQATQFAQEQALLHDKLVSARRDEVRLQQDEALAKQKQEEAARALQLAQLSRAACQEKLDDFNVHSRLERKQSAELRRDALLTAEQQWRLLAENQISKTQLDVAVEQLHDAIKQHESALMRSEELIPGANAALLQAERSLKGAEAACARNVETLRAALEEHAACPVCGSLQHPYRSENPQLHAVLANLQEEVTRCREQAQQLKLQQTKHNAMLTSSRSQLASSNQQLLKLDETIQRGKAEWQSHALASELDDIDADERTPWLARQKQQVLALLQAISEEEKSERAAALARDQAQADYDNAAKQHMLRKDKAMALHASLVKAQAASVASSENHDAVLARMEETLLGLDAAFDNQEWRKTWHDAPATFYEKLKSSIGLWQTHSRARAERQAQLDKLDVAYAALAEALTKASAEASRRADVVVESCAAIANIQAERRALFAGKTSQQVQAELAVALATAKRALEQKLEFSQQQAHSQTRLQEARDQAKKRLAELTHAATSAATAQETWLVQYNESSPTTAIDSEQLRTLLAPTVDWISSEREQLHLFDSALQKAATVLHERQQQRLLHEQSRPTADDANTVTAGLRLLENEHQLAHTTATARQLALAQDQARRQQSTSLLDEIEHQETTHRLWAQLNDLIGSADGKKFRNYAQQFTLDVLLGYANHHLAELSRRYRLERINDTLSLMVVDQDMGDELRSVHSLSGGESFLVSLALALGLASLSSNRVRVESLFIDEGFGSLDPETLSVAMDALDGLQAMGRKVGVISHVQEMTERIATRILVQRMAGGMSQVLIA